MGQGPDRSIAADDLDERWRELGRVLAERSPDLLEQAVTFFERLAVTIVDRRDTAPPSDPDPI